jgi:hypothetical protein
MSLITGVNKIFEHAGREYHLQAEDLGSETAAYEARVYDGGSVLWLKRIPYADLEAKGLPKAERDQALRALMEKTILTVQVAITKGKIG